MIPHLRTLPMYFGQRGAYGRTTLLDGIDLADIDMGSITVPIGASLDMQTITSPNLVSYDFGDI